MVTFKHKKPNSKRKAMKKNVNKTKKSNNIVLAMKPLKATKLDRVET